MLRCCWKSSDATLKCCWKLADAMLRCCWKSPDATLRCCWKSPGATLRCCWKSPDAMLRCCWKSPEATLRCCWKSPDATLRCCWVLLENILKGIKNVFLKNFTKIKRKSKFKGIMTQFLLMLKFMQLKLKLAHCAHYDKVEQSMLYNCRWLVNSHGERKRKKNKKNWGL